MAENKHVASAGDVVEAMTGKPQPTFHGFETVSCSGERGLGRWFQHGLASMVVLHKLLNNHHLSATS